MKKKNVIIIICIIVLLVITSITIMIVVSSDKKVTPSENSEKNYSISSTKSKIYSLLVKDYKIRDIIYGDVSLSDTHLTINNVNYYKYIDTEFNTAAKINKVIDNNYDVIESANLHRLIGKYNIKIEFKNNIYIDKHPKCTLPKLTNDIGVESVTKNEIVYLYNNKEYEISIDNGKYKLNTSPFSCETETTSIKS
jgi:hypothetical protein